MAPILSVRRRPRIHLHPRHRLGHHLTLVLQRSNVFAASTRVQCNEKDWFDLFMWRDFHKSDGADRCRDYLSGVHGTPNGPETGVFGNLFAEVNSGHRCLPRAHHGGHGRICSRDEAWRVEHPALCVLLGFLSCLPCSSQDRRIGVRRPFQYVSIAKLSGELELVGIWMF